MTHAPVTKLVRKDSLNFSLRALLDKCVEQDNLFLPGQAGEIGVRVGGALGAVDDLELAERELQTGGQSFDAVLQRAGLERRELVEDRDDDDGVDGDGEELHAEREGPKVEEELVAGLLDDLEEGCTDWDTECQSEGLRFEHVGHPEAKRLLVEAEGLLEDEMVVVAERKGEECLRERVGEAEEQALCDLALEA